MQRRTPTAGTRDQIARQSPRRTCEHVLIGAQRRNHRAGNPTSTDGFRDRVAGNDLDTRVLCRRHPSAVRILPGIHDRGDSTAQGVPIQRGAIAVVIGREEQQAVAGRDGVAVDVGGHRRRQHDAGKVVVGEHRRSLDGTGREHHLLGPNPMQPLPRPGHGHRPQVVRSPFDDGQEVVVVVAADRTPGQQLDICERVKLGQGTVPPSGGAFPT